MRRKFKVAAAQTGPVLGGMREGVEAACAMVQEDKRWGRTDVSRRAVARRQ
jgi:hypothetical protein